MAVTPPDHVDLWLWLKLNFDELKLKNNISPNLTINFISFSCSWAWWDKILLSIILNLKQNKNNNPKWIQGQMESFQNHPILLMKKRNNCALQMSYSSTSLDEVWYIIHNDLTWSWWNSFENKWNNDLTLCCKGNDVVGIFNLHFSWDWDQEIILHQMNQLLKAVCSSNWVR